MIKYFDNSDKSITFVKWNFCENHKERFAKLQKAGDKVFLSYASVSLENLRRCAVSYGQRHGFRIYCRRGIMDGFVGLLVVRVTGFGPDDPYIDPFAND